MKKESSNLRSLNALYKKKLLELKAIKERQKRILAEMTSRLGTPTLKWYESGFNPDNEAEFKAEVIKITSELNCAIEEEIKGENKDEVSGRKDKSSTDLGAN